MDVSDRRMQVQLTPEAKIASDFLLYQSDFCGCGLCQRSERREHELPALFCASRIRKKGAATYPRAGHGRPCFCCL